MDLNVLLSLPLPKVADVFCAESSAIHNQLVIAPLERRHADAIIFWLHASGWVSNSGDTMTINRTPQQTNEIMTRRRRGARKWAIGVTSRNRTPSEPVTTIIPWGPNQDYMVPPPEPLFTLMEWLLRAVCLTMKPREDQVSPLLWMWSTRTPIPGAYRSSPFLRSLFEKIVVVLQQTSSMTVRTSQIQQLFNVAVWSIAGSGFTHAYIQNLLVPDLLHLKICGLEGIRELIIHYDGRGDEWYISTEGSHREIAVAIFRSATCGGSIPKWTSPSIVGGA